MRKKAYICYLGNSDCYRGVRAYNKFHAKLLSLKWFKEVICKDCICSYNCYKIDPSKLRFSNINVQKY